MTFYRIVLKRTDGGNDVRSTKANADFAAALASARESRDLALLTGRYTSAWIHQRFK